MDDFLCRLAYLFGYLSTFSLKLYAKRKERELGGYLLDLEAKPKPGGRVAVIESHGRVENTELEGA